MDVLSLILIALALSIDSFAASVSTGACMKNPIKILYLKVAGFMTIFQGSLPLAGWLIGSKFKSLIQDFDHWIAFFLLLLIGLKMIYEGFKKQKSENCFCPTRTLFLMSMALATSIDALIVGIGFGVLGTPILIAISIIAFATFVASYFGVLIGRKIRHRLNFRLEIPAGIVLIMLGTKILFEHLGIIQF